ncbi:MAG: Lsr2 family protein [Dactylosporangium sp.]|nr:Lsr2 family protein [Dactylosporangium sp.]
MNAALPDRDVDPSDVRAWAKAQGLPVAARGRVSADLIARYRVATGR